MKIFDRNALEVIENGRKSLKRRRTSNHLKSLTELIGDNRRRSEQLHKEEKDGVATLVSRLQVIAENSDLANAIDIVLYGRIQRLRVATCFSVLRNGRGYRGEGLVIEVEKKDNRESGRVACVRYMSDRNIA